MFMNNIIPEEVTDKKEKDKKNNYKFGEKFLACFKSSRDILHHTLSINMTTT